MTDAAAVLSYWFGDERDPIDSIGALERRGTKWFYGGPEIDREIAERFGGDLERARRGELDDWAETPRERLALIVLLDQFSRNVFRGTPLSYAQDAVAQRLAVTGLEASMDQDLALHERLFFSLPLSHAEDNVLQERGLAYAERVTNEAPPAVRSFYERGLEHRAQAPRRRRPLRPLPHAKRHPRPRVDAPGDHVPRGAEDHRRDALSAAAGVWLVRAEDRLAESLGQGLGRLAGLVLHVVARAVLAEQAHDFVAAARREDGAVERRVALVVAAIGVGALGEQEARHLRQHLLGGEVQRRPVVGVGGVHVGLRLEQQTDERDAVPEDRRDERRAPLAVAGVGAGAALEQVAYAQKVAHERRLCELVIQEAGRLDRHARSIARAGHSKASE